jgi:hypothetical protein
LIEDPKAYIAKRKLKECSADLLDLLMGLLKPEAAERFDMD